MALVAIDFSVTSTAVVVDVGGKRSHFVFIPGMDRTSKYKGHRALEGHLTVVEYGKERRTDQEYSEKEMSKLRDAMSLSSAVVREVGAVTGGTIPSFYFEGFSYASKGASFLDLVVFNSFTKKAIMDAFPGSIIDVYSPATIKMVYSGKGNHKKPEMYKAFSEKEVGPLRDAIVDLVGPYDPSMKIPKPVDDVVDAIAICSMAVSGYSPKRK